MEGLINLQPVEEQMHKNADVVSSEVMSASIPKKNVKGFVLAPQDTM